MPIVNYTPHDWSSGEFVTDTLMDAEVRDPWTNIQSAWTAYTPVWTAATTNPVIGNGSFTGSAYQRVGKTIDFVIVITAGSTTTFGTGQWNISLPFTPKQDGLRFANGNLFDSSASLRYTCSSTWIAGSSINALWTPPTTAGVNERAVNPTQPFTWATSDVLTLNGRYETT